MPFHLLVYIQVSWSAYTSPRIFLFSSDFLLPGSPGISSISLKKGILALNFPFPRHVLQPRKYVCTLLPLRVAEHFS